MVTPTAPQIIARFDATELEINRAVDSEGIPKPGYLIDPKRTLWYRDKLQELRGIWQEYQDLTNGTKPQVNATFATRIVTMFVKLDPWLAAQANVPSDSSEGKSSSREGDSSADLPLSSSFSPVLARIPSGIVIPTIALMPPALPDDPSVSPRRLTAQLAAKPCVVHTPTSE